MLDDPFIHKAVTLLASRPENVRAIGSYVRWGRSHACDLDLNEAAADPLPDITIPYLRRLRTLHSAGALHISTVYFDVHDDRIRAITDSLGYLDGNFMIHDITLTRDQLPADLPPETRTFVHKFLQRRQHDDLTHYLALYAFLHKRVRPTWSFSDLKEETMRWNGRTWSIHNMPQYSYLYVEAIVDGFRVSNLLYDPSLYDRSISILTFSLSDVITHDAKIDTFQFIRHVQYLMKHLGRTSTQEKIKSFRHRMGRRLHRICTLDNEIELGRPGCPKAIKALRTLQKELETISSNFLVKHLSKYRRYFGRLKYLP